MPAIVTVLIVVIPPFLTVTGGAFWVTRGDDTGEDFAEEMGPVILGSLIVFLLSAIAGFLFWHFIGSGLR